MFISIVSCYMGLFLALTSVYSVVTQTGDPIITTIVGLIGIAGLYGGLLGVYLSDN